MKLEEAINHYLELKPCENWIENIDAKFFFEFAETLLHYIKEESIPIVVVKEKIKEIDEILKGIDYHDIEDKQEREFYQKEYMKQICAKYALQEILTKGESK